MTVREPCPEAPGPLEASARQFDACFGTLAQRRAFRASLQGLLLPRDRAGTHAPPLTHEFLAQMLAVRRASVTDALAPLQAAGLLRQDRGQVTLLDGPGLAAAACPCYALIRAEFAARAALAPGGGIAVVVNGVPLCYVTG